MALEQLYEDVIANEDKKKEFLEAAKNKQIDAFLKKYDCPATKEEIVQFVKDKKEGELSDEELDMVSGEGCDSELAYSILTFGTACY